MITKQDPNKHKNMIQNGKFPEEKLFWNWKFKATNCYTQESAWSINNQTKVKVNIKAVWSEGWIEKRL